MLHLVVGAQVLTMADHCTSLLVSHASHQLPDSQITECQDIHSHLPMSCRPDTLSATCLNSLSVHIVQPHGLQGLQIQNQEPGQHPPPGPALTPQSMCVNATSGTTWPQTACAAPPHPLTVLPCAPPPGLHQVTYIFPVESGGRSLYKTVAAGNCRCTKLVPFVYSLQCCVSLARLYSGLYRKPYELPNAHWSTLGEVSNVEES